MRTSVLSIMRWSALPLVAALPLVLCRARSGDDGPGLSQEQQQTLRDRLFQTNLRGPRWTGNDNQNTLTELVADSMDLAGLDVSTSDYDIYRWDPRWWSLTLTLTNGTTIGVPTTGYWPYSGNSGLKGVIAPVRDAGTFSLLPNQDGDPSTLNLTGIPPSGAIIFFDNPSPTHNYSAPGYSLLGTSRNISASLIPELGNLTNPHWQSAKTLNWTALRQAGVVGAISSWVGTSDENAQLQFLPNDGAPGALNATYNVPALYVGNSTGAMIRGLIAGNQILTAKLVLDAPGEWSTTQTVFGHLDGMADTDDTIILYTHSDGPSIIEENGPILLLSMAEYFAENPINMNLDFVITTGHMSGKHLNESRWMDERPSIVANAKFAIACEHFGAIEWKDVLDAVTGAPVYQATGQLEPMWTMANESKLSGGLHQSYLNSFDGTPDDLRMALVAPGRLNGSRSMWYGVGGSAVLGRGNVPTVGIIPQPDYLWAQMVDGGISKLDFETLFAQVNVILELVYKLDARFGPAPDPSH